MIIRFNKEFINFRDTKLLLEQRCKLIEEEAYK